MTGELEAGTAQRFVLEWFELIHLVNIDAGMNIKLCRALLVLILIVILKKFLQHTPSVCNYIILTDIC